MLAVLDVPYRVDWGDYLWVRVIIFNSFKRNDKYLACVTLRDSCVPLWCTYTCFIQFSEKRRLYSRDAIIAIFFLWQRKVTSMSLDETCNGILWGWIPIQISPRAPSVTEQVSVGMYPAGLWLSYGFQSEIFT